MVRTSVPPSSWKTSAPRPSPTPRAVRPFLREFLSDRRIEEVDQLNRETFTTAGGGRFHYVPWGNDSDGVIATLAQQARKVLAGWI